MDSEKRSELEKLFFSLANLLGVDLKTPNIVIADGKSPAISIGTEKWESRTRSYNGVLNAVVYPQGNNTNYKESVIITGPNLPGIDIKVFNQAGPLANVVRKAVYELRTFQEGSDKACLLNPGVIYIGSKGQVLQEYGVLPCLRRD